MDKNTSSLLVYLMIFLFLSGVFVSGVLYVFSGAAEPTSGHQPPNPPTTYDPLTWLLYVAQTLGYIGGLVAAFAVSLLTIPAPYSWLISGTFVIVIVSVIILIIRG